MKVEIANRLYEYRRASGMSQEKVASLLGVSRQAVSKWECAESSPDTDNLIALAQLYGVSIDELLFADPEEPEETLSIVECDCGPEREEEPEADEACPEDSASEQPCAEQSSYAGYERPGGRDYVDISFERGVHVRDSKKGEEVHVGWDGIHIDSGDEHVHIDFKNFKDIAQAFRQARKSQQ